jgi:hypothetical protein
MTVKCIFLLNTLTMKKQLLFYWAKVMTFKKKSEGFKKKGPGPFFGAENWGQSPIFLSDGLG